MNWRKLWQIGTFTCLSLYFAAMFIPRKLPFDQISSVHTNIFKTFFNHMLYYSGPLEPVANFFFLMPVFSFLLLNLGKSGAVPAFYICILLSAFSELLQKLIPGRVSSLQDFLLNSTGAVTAYFIFKLTSKAKIASERF